MSEIIQQPDNRRAFIDTLIELAEKDDKIILIVPDVGFNYIEKFKEKFPERYFNFGVTEQSTVMIAVGLSLSGFKPYVYSMINFVLFRPYEMVRNGIVHHKANVKLLGVKGSSAYKFLGFSHNMNDDEEDIQACNNLGLRCYIPEKGTHGTSQDRVKHTVFNSYMDPSPAYIRL